jgi:hypothetical protein
MSWAVAFGDVRKPGSRTAVPSDKVIVALPSEPVVIAISHSNDQILALSAQRFRQGRYLPRFTDGNCELYRKVQWVTIED